MMLIYRPSWTPANLAKPPRCWVDARDASWNGSTLASIGNRGLDKGATIPQGAPTRGRALGHCPSIRLGPGANRIDASLGAWGSQQLFVLWFGALETAGAGGAILGKGWPGGGANDIAIYATTGGSGILAFGNNCCTIGVDNPSSQLAAEVITDTAPHSVGVQLGATNVTWLDGVAQTLGTSGTAAAPNYIAATWNLGTGALSAFGGGDNEGLNGDTLAWVILDYFPSVDDRQKLEGYYHHQAGVQAKLAAAHPYKNRRP